MPTSAFAGIPYPAATDPDNVPVDLQEVAEHLDSRVVLRATSETDRDTRYPSAPDGTLCVNTADGTQWLRAGGAWLVMWEPTTAWTDCTLGSGLTGPVQVRRMRVGGKRVIHMRGQLRQTSGSDLTTTMMSGGTILLTVPVGFRPATSYGDRLYLPLSASLAGDAYVGQARAEVLTDATGTPGAVYVYGHQTAHSSATWETAAWVAFDGASFWVED